MILGKDRIEVDDVVLAKYIKDSFPTIMSGFFRLEAATNIVKTLHLLAGDGLEETKHATTPDEGAVVEDAPIETPPSDSSLSTGGSL